MTVSDLINGMLREDGGFQKAFRSILDDELNMSLNEFCQLSGISQSTMYKILEDKREPNLRTVRQVIKSLKVLMEPEDSHFIGVIAFTTVLENLPKSIDMDGLTVSVREYPVSTVEDAIIAAVRAERPSRRSCPYRCPVSYPRQASCWPSTGSRTWSENPFPITFQFSYSNNKLIYQLNRGHLSVPCSSCRSLATRP